MGLTLKSRRMIYHFHEISTLLAWISCCGRGLQFLKTALSNVISNTLSPSENHGFRSSQPQQYNRGQITFLMMPQSGRSLPCQRLTKLLIGAYMKLNTRLTEVAQIAGLHENTEFTTTSFSTNDETNTSWCDTHNSLQLNVVELHHLEVHNPSVLRNSSFHSTFSSSTPRTHCTPPLTP